MGQPILNPRDLMGDALHREILSTKQSLPPVPTVLAKARQIASSPRSSLADLAAVLETDSALTVRVLRLSNTAYYRRGQPVNSIQQACGALGMQALLSLVVIISMERMCSRPLESYGLRPESLYRHALGVAFAARIIAFLRMPKLAEDAFTVGVIHDMGKMILDPYLVARGVAWPSSRSGEPLCLAEQDALGLHHADIGASFCAHWQLSEIQANAVRYHHHPHHPDAHPLAAVIYLADYLAHADETNPIQDEQVMDYCLGVLRFVAEDLDYLRDETAAAVAEAQS